MAQALTSGESSMTFRAMTVRATLLVLLLCLPILPQSTGYEFVEGCCINRQAFPRPTEVSTATISSDVLLGALHCAMSSQLVGDGKHIAGYLGTGNELLISYYYGKYMPEQDGPALTIGVYSLDGSRGMLFDVSAEKDEYAVTNIPLLRKSNQRWRVGEINGGIWSYTRLYYLAQEVGARPRQAVSLRTVEAHRVTGCWVMSEKVH